MLHTPHQKPATATACIRILWACALAWAGLAAAPAAQAQTGPASQAQTSLRSQLGRLMLVQPGGDVLDLSALPGVELQLDDGRQIRIDGVEQSTDVRGQPVWLHRVQVADPAPATGATPAVQPAAQPAVTWRPLCELHSDGTQHALFIAGRQQADGRVLEDADAFAVSCTSGALAKCRRFGYDPEGHDAQQRPLRDAYNACIRMVRADYGGGGVPHTQNGRLIDVYDDLGVQKPDMAPDQHFEAGWTSQGAVCVHHPRVLQEATLAGLEQRYPQLRGRVGAVCTEALARSLGATLFNRSAPQP